MSHLSPYSPHPGSVKEGLMSNINFQRKILYGSKYMSALCARLISVCRAVCVLSSVVLSGVVPQVMSAGNLEYMPLKMYPGECSVRAMTEGKVSDDGFLIDRPVETSGEVEMLRSVEIAGATYRVTEVAWGAFEGCDVGVLRLPGSITEVGTLAFARAKGDVTVTGSVDVIGHYAFAEVTGSVKINEGVRYICDNAFGGYKPDRGRGSDAILVLPSTVESVGRNILGNSLGGSEDARVDTLQCHAIEPPMVEIGADGDYDLFENMESYRRVVLCVPDGSVESYRSAPGWSKFAEISVLSAAGIESVIAEADIEIGVRDGMCVIVSSDTRPIPVKIYSLEGRQVYFGHDREIALRTGVYVVRAATTTAKIAVK